jgi:hypothetical protein
MRGGRGLVTDGDGVDSVLCVVQIQLDILFILACGHPNPN